MSLLREIQENFQRYLQQDHAAIENYIVASEADFAKERLLIYKDAYFIRLIDTLRQNYPGVAALLGNAAFNEMASTYIDLKPSQYFSINDFGNHVPTFLFETEPYKNRPELAEMARFEFALDKAIHTLDAPILTPEDLMQIPQERWPEVKIQPHPSAQILTLHYNLPDIWQSAVEKQPVPALVMTAPTAWLVWQKNINTFYLKLNPQDVFIMESFKNHLCMADICEGLCEWLKEEEVPEYFIKTTLNWVHDKLLSQLSLF